VRAPEIVTAMGGKCSDRNAVMLLSSVGNRLSSRRRDGLVLVQRMAFPCPMRSSDPTTLLLVKILHDSANNTLSHSAH